MTLELILPNDQSSASAVCKIWLLQQLLNFVFFRIDYVQSLVIAFVSWATLLVNLYFVQERDGNFSADFIFGLMWLSVSVMALSLQSPKKEE